MGCCCPVAAHRCSSSKPSPLPRPPDARNNHPRGQLKAPADHRPPQSQHGQKLQPSSANTGWRFHNGQIVPAARPSCQLNHRTHNISPWTAPTVSRRLRPISATTAKADAVRGSSRRSSNYTAHVAPGRPCTGAPAHTHPSRAYLVPKPERTSEKPSHDLTTSSVRILNHQCSIFRFSCFRSTSHHHHVANSDRFTHTLPLHPGEGGEGNIRRG